MMDFLSYIFPQSCGICGKPVNNFICKKCELILKGQAKFIIDNETYKCDKENQNIEEKEFFFDEHIYIFKYEEIIRKILISYKFNDKSYLYKTIVNFLLKNEKTFKKIESYDTIIPIPISKKRFKERGYNQSLLIAREISINIKLKLLENVLIKNKDIVAQSSLNKKERFKNVLNVYELNNKHMYKEIKKHIENKKVLLIDDIYTTGNTVNEASRILKQAFPNKIGVLTIAKD